MSVTAIVYPITILYYYFEVSLINYIYYDLGIICMFAYCTLKLAKVTEATTSVEQYRHDTGSLSNPLTLNSSLSNYCAGINIICIITGELFVENVYY